MTSHLVVRSPLEGLDDGLEYEGLGGNNSTISSQPCYWDESNHHSDSFLRIENWKTSEIAAFCLPSPHHEILPLSLPLINALLKYREEIKFYAALVDQQLLSDDSLASIHRLPPPSSSQPPISSIEYPQFLDFHFRRIQRDWTTDSRQEWLQEIQHFEHDVQEIIGTIFNNKPIFIKLSVRSPKDAVFYLQSTYDRIRSNILEQQPPLLLSDPTLLHSNIHVLKSVAYQALQVNSGADAVNLLTRSNRIYLDLLQAELFSQRTSMPLEINLHLLEYCTEFNPNYEFRGFCSNGKLTSLTIYNPWIYDPFLVENRVRIFGLIHDLWKKIAQIYPGDDYCLDFALNSDLSRVYLIEINAFLPPLAGSGLFNMNSIEDQNIIKYGANMMPEDDSNELSNDDPTRIVFRLREGYVREEEMKIIKVDPKSGKKSTVTYAPGPELVMKYIQQCREEALGICEEHKAAQTPSSCQIM